MRFMVHIEVPTDVGSRSDFEGEGPSPIVKHFVERFNPETFYLTPSRRAIWMVADLDEVKMTEIMLAASKNLGVYPTFTPVVPRADALQIAEKAIEALKKP